MTSKELPRLFLVLICLSSQGMSYPWSDKDKLEVGRIVNGEMAKPGELAYQASLQLSFGGRLISTKVGHFCGAAMIGDNWAITAAHCMKNQKAGSLKIVAGTTDITDQSSPTYRVEKIIVADYNDHTKKNDLSLLKLEASPENIDRTKSHAVKVIDLCRASFQPEGRNCTVSGWGHLKQKGQRVPDKLRKVSVRVLHGEICAKMLESYPWDSKDNTMICAGGEDKDACQGDSGGPMVCEDDSGKQCLAGLVSWGVGCAMEGIPGVYTNLRNYLEWIENQID